MSVLWSYCVLNIDSYAFAFVCGCYSIFIEEDFNLESFVRNVLQPDEISTHNWDKVTESIMKCLQQEFESDIVHIVKVCMYK